MCELHVRAQSATRSAGVHIVSGRPPRSQCRLPVVEVGAVPGILAAKRTLAETSPVENTSGSSVLACVGPDLKWFAHGAEPTGICKSPPGAHTRLGVFLWDDVAGVTRTVRAVEHRLS